MSESNDWTRRKVQGVGKSSYRMSIPREFAQNLEEVEYIHSGDFLITRPADYSEGPQEERVAFPDELENETEPERFHSIVGNILESLCIASVDVIHVEFPDKLNEEQRDLYDQAWFQQQEYAPDSLRWSMEEQQMEIKGGIDFNTYIMDVKQYIYRYFLKPLNRKSGFRYNFVESPYGFGYKSHTLDDKEGEIDTRWALATRNIGDKFYNLNRDEFAKGICGIYIGKYLEMCIDIVKRLVETLATFEVKYPGIEREVKNEIHNLFNLEGRKRFDNRIEETAKNSYSMKSTEKDFLAENEKYRTDQMEINEKREKCFEDFDSEINNAASAGLLYGQTLTFCERLLRFPRSICHVGVGARKVNEVHQMRTSEQE